MLIPLLSCQVFEKVLLLLQNICFTGLLRTKCGSAFMHIYVYREIDRGWLKFYFMIIFIYTYIYISIFHRTIHITVLYYIYLHLHTQYMYISYVCKYVNLFCFA